MKKLFRWLFLSSLIVLICSLFMALRIYIDDHMPDNFYSVDRKEITISTFVPFINLKVKNGQNSVSAASNVYDCNLTFCNIPLKKVKLNIVERKNVIPCGIPFGAKIFTGGIVVVKYTDVETESGDVCPAKNASIQIGDVITHVENIPVDSVEEFSKLIENSLGNGLNVDVIRKNLKFSTTITPVKSVKENIYRAGIWVRDSSSGIGTITFIDENSSYFAGLGHGIRDADTNDLIPLSHGEIMKASIKSVVKPSSKNAGELRGCFSGNNPIGTIESNNDSGVYGTLTSKIESKFDLCGVAMKQEIEKGPAKIISTVEGNSPQIYDINIDNVNFDKKNTNKNISISVCDKNLISKTGGVVQGMSGSPIIQNNMLVGAITHVVSDNPLKGYGIFAETMVNNQIFKRLCTIL